VCLVPTDGASIGEHKRISAMPKDRVSIAVSLALRTSANKVKEFGATPTDRAHADSSFRTDTQPADFDSRVDLISYDNLALAYESNRRSNVLDNAILPVSGGDQKAVRVGHLQALIPKFWPPLAADQ
jgi:hypothetical protein